MNIPPDLQQLMLSIFTMLCVIAPLIVAQLVRNRFKTGSYQPQNKKPIRLKSPALFYLSIPMFGIAAILSFVFGSPYHGALFALATAAYVYGYYRFTKNPVEADSDEAPNQAPDENLNLNMFKFIATVVFLSLVATFAYRYLVSIVFFKFSIPTPQMDLTPGILIVILFIIMANLKDLVREGRLNWLTKSQSLL